MYYVKILDIVTICNNIFKNSKVFQKVADIYFVNLMKNRDITRKG